MNDAAILMQRAEQFPIDNPDAWAFMVKLAKREADACRHFSAGWLVEQTRKYAFIPKTDDLFKINNNLTPAFARMLVKEYPYMRPYLEMRRSVLDELEKA